MSFSNPQVSIALDADLVHWVDQIIGHTLNPDQDNSSPEAIEQKRIAAIESAVRDWCKQQNQQRLQRSADLHRQRHNNDETGWLV
jgi:hypothetical protein